MVKVKNVTEEVLCVPNYPAFQPGEVRECTEEEQTYFLNNPGFQDPEVMEAAPDRVNKTEQTAAAEEEKEIEEEETRRNRRNR